MDDDQKQQQKDSEDEVVDKVDENGKEETVNEKVLQFMEDHGINQETAESALKLIDEGYPVDEAIEKA